MTQIAIGCNISMSLQGVPQHVLDDIQKDLTFLNPQYVNIVKRQKTPYNTPKHIKFFKTANSQIIMPQGYMSCLLAKLKNCGLSHEVVDNTTNKPLEKPIDFNGTLYDYQVPAAQAMISRRYGILHAPAGSGKTLTALFIIAQRNQPTLIVVHNKMLMYQWQQRIATFTDIPIDEIGLLGDTRKTIGTTVTVSIINSLLNNVESLSDMFGHVVIDECHRSGSKIYNKALGRLSPAFMLGLSATPYRPDGMTQAMQHLIGPVTHVISTRTVRKAKGIVGACYVTRKTPFEFSYDDNYSTMINTLAGDVQRNMFIVNDVIKAAKACPQESLLVISDRTFQIEKLTEFINDGGVNAEFVVGKTPSAAKKDIMHRLRKKQTKVLLATSQLIGEGFDCGILSSIFIATPIKYPGRVIQYVGRVTRTAKDKSQATIYDYYDHKIGVLRSSYKKRVETYEDLDIFPK